MLPALIACGLGRSSVAGPALACAAASLRRAMSSVAASAPAELATVNLPVAEGEEATVLLTLPQRPFSATAALPADLAKSLDGKPRRIAVVRPAFAPFDAPQTPVTQLVSPLGGRAVALASASQEPAGRQLVDEYVRFGSSYSLERPSVELAAYLAGRGSRLALVPDVAAAVAGLVAAATGTGAAPNSVAAATGSRSGQSTNRVLMVAPTAFGFNEQAAADNSFMHSAEPAGPGSSLTAAVCAEYAGLHRALTEGAGVEVVLAAHAASHGTPDAVFPNNWFSTHAAGEAAGGVGSRALVLYPMKCANRAAERRPELVELLQRWGGYGRVVDMSGHERHGKAYFEGTGVLVLDRVNGVAYVSLSERAAAPLAEAWAAALGYRELVTFHSTDGRGKPVYHTNVMMAVGTDVAVVCGEAVRDDKERQHLMSKLSKHHAVVDISAAQMDALCGNVLELQSGHGLPVLAMSSQAYHAFTPQQRGLLRRHVADLVHAPIDTLERVGGGGVRCAIAELF